MENSKSKIDEFWDEQAARYGAASFATVPDQHYRRLEIACIIRALKAEEFKTALDVGCGNGFSTLIFAQMFPDVTFIGIDKSPKMIEQARAAAKDMGVTNVWFGEGDVLELTKNKELDGKFDVVLTERCLINLKNFPEQKLAILEMRRMLSPQGRLILVENTQAGLENLNRLRERYGLDEIKTRWHNFYIPDADFADFMASASGLLALLSVENIGNMYYILSRVVYAKLAKDRGEEIDYDNAINEIASTMPTFGSGHACSPNFMFVFRNIE